MMTLWLSLLCSAVPPVSGSDVYALLKARGVGVDAEAANRVAEEAVVRLADPGASFVDAEGMSQWMTGSTNSPSLQELGEGLWVLKADAIDDAAATLTASGLVRAAESGGGLILDCRGAGGTNWNAVDAIAARVNDPDTFLYAVQDGVGEDLELHAAPAALRAEAPVLMLTDRHTSGAAELLAAVLARSHGVLLVGEPTKGDAVRREWTPLSRDRFAYMGTGRFVLPDGSSWSGKGVMPHVRMADPSASPVEIGTNTVSRTGKPLDAATIRHRELFARVSRDAALSRAVDLLLGLKALAVFPEKAHAPSVAESH